MVLNETNFDQTLEMMVEVVTVDVECGLKLHRTHFRRLR